MNRLFISCENDFPKLITRNRAKGHKSLIIDDSITSFSGFEMKTNGNALNIIPNEFDGDPDAFTILCKEFGLDDVKNCHSDISVIFLDNGYMLVTLYKGAIALNMEDENGETKLLAPSINIESNPNFDAESILWVNAENILSYSKYFNEYKNLFLYDFEFFFQIAGTNENNMHSMKLKACKDKDIDISLGQYAQYLDIKQKKNESKRATNLMKMFNSEQALEFDDDDEDDTEDDDDYDY